MDKNDPVQAAIDSLVKLAGEAGVTDSAFSEEVESKKRFEAQMINRAGLPSQIKYILAEYGPLMLKQGIDKVETIIVDNARRGKTVECCRCNCVEFLSRAFVHGKQQYYCHRCHEASK